MSSLESQTIVPTATALGRVILWWAVTAALDMGSLFIKNHARVCQLGLRRVSIRSSWGETGHRVLGVKNVCPGAIGHLDLNHGQEADRRLFR